MYVTIFVLWKGSIVMGRMKKVDVPHLKFGSQVQVWVDGEKFSYYVSGHLIEVV